MAKKALVQARIDPAVKKKAANVLEGAGLTVSDAVRIFLTRTANEGVPPFLFGEPSAEYDEWFRTKVQEALADPRPEVPDREVTLYFAKRRKLARRRSPLKSIQK